MNTPVHAPLIGMRRGGLRVWLLMLGLLQAVAHLAAQAQTTAPFVQQLQAPANADVTDTSATDTPSTAPSAAELALQLIEAKRAHVEAGFDQDRAACYQRFWVNTCVREAKARRRVLMEDLRRQEISVNDEQRRLRGGEQQLRIDERQSEQALQEALERREQALKDTQTRLDNAAQKQREREAITAPEPRQPSASKAPSESEKITSREAFDDKQRAAAEKKAQVDKALADKAAKPVPPGAPPTALPTPR